MLRLPEVVAADAAGTIAVEIERPTVRGDFRAQVIVFGVDRRERLGGLPAIAGPQRVENVRLPAGLAAHEEHHATVGQDARLVLVGGGIELGGHRRGRLPENLAQPRGLGGLANVPGITVIGLVPRP